LVWPFPIVNDAEFILLDVTARPTMHPNDLKSSIERLLRDEGFGVRDAADGYLLLQRGAGAEALPDAFYSAFTTDSARPQQRVAVDFGPALRLIGYDIEDVDEGRQPWTRVRLYWQVRGAVPEDLRLYPYYLDDAGRVIEDTTQRPLVATLWYPPGRWQVGQTIVVETLPWPLGERFRLAVGVVRGGDWSNRSARLAPALVESAGPVRLLDDGTAIELGRYRRIVTSLATAQEPRPAPATKLSATLGGEIALLGYDLQGAVAPGGSVQLTLYWQALTRPSADYHTFAHVYDRAGQVAAQDDGVTGGVQPATWWFPRQVITETRTIAVPATAPADVPATIWIGLYRVDSGARLPVTRDGKPQGDAIRLP